MIVSIGDARQHRLEVDAGHLQCGPLKIEHIAVRSALQRQRDPVDPEQRLERWIFIVALGRDLDENVLALVGVIADECKAGIAATKLAVVGVNYAGAGAMNGVKFNLVKSFLQCRSPVVFDCTKMKTIGAVVSNAFDYRLADGEPPDATRVSAGVAAILTSTSLTGLSVQARVT